MSNVSAVFFGAVALYIIGNGMTATITIQPFKYHGLFTASFNLTCKPQLTWVCAKKVLAIQVSKEGGRPLVTLQNTNEISYNRLMRGHVKADGYISKSVSDSRLTVEFSNAVKEDSGQYSCTTIYLDDWNFLQQENASKNFTVQHQDVQDIVRYLMTKVDSMEAVILQQQKQLTEQEEQFLHLENRTSHYIDRDDQFSAFSAGPSYTQHGSALTDRQVLVFSEVTNNVGQDYNQHTGQYTAPVNGLYSLHLHVAVRTVGGSLAKTDIGIEKTGGYDYEFPQRLGTVSLGPGVSSDQSSVHVVVFLEAGDKISCVVSLTPSMDSVLVDGFPSTGFTGYLVRAF